MSTLQVDTIQGKTTAGTVAMPAGMIIQIVQTTPTTTSHVTVASSSLVEASTTMRVSITPKFATSLLRFNFQCLTGGRNTSGIMSYKFFDITNSANVGSSSLGTGSSRTFVNASMRTADSDGNDRHHLNMTAYQSASNTNARTYGIYASIELNTMDFNMTATDNAGCSYAPPVFTVEEIAQ
tara:strand:- start:132 stop:674 length:543 start_codon:yes stop_codon:yes gene_type:complete